VDTPCEVETDGSCNGTCQGLLASTCKAFDFWLCNSRVSGTGSSGLGSPSGLTQESTWIMAMVEAHYEGGCTSYIQILGALAIEDELASEVIWAFFLRVGVLIGLLGVTMDSITSGEIGTRHWMGKQRAAAVVAAEECSNNADLEWLLPARWDLKGVLDSRARLFLWHTISNLGSIIFLLTAIYL